MINANLRPALLCIALLVPVSLSATPPADPGQPPLAQSRPGVEDHAACAQPGTLFQALEPMGGEAPAQPFVERQSTGNCPMDYCNDWCAEVCWENGGEPWTCQYYPRSGRCEGICWCY